uniref:Zinc transporter n=1 Tax=Anopheles atroparvus TaxID=41427 RepID=A0A182JFC6_ANOAO
MASLPKFLKLVLLTLVASATVGVCANQASVIARGADEQNTTTTESASEPPMPTATAAPPITVDSENKFLKYLFNKYGSKGVISFEGLEHLMHSLGLGGLDFTGTHSLKEHRPDGYDFGDYDVYDAVNQLDAEGRLHAHRHGEDGATPEPPVITFASVPTDSAGDRRQHHDEHEHNHVHAGVDEQQTSTVGSSVDTRIPTSASSTHSAPERPRSATTFREANPSSDDSHVWQEIIFKDMHDPRHRHPRNKNVPYCLSPMSIVHLVMEEPLLAAKQESQRRARSLAHQHAHGPTGHQHDHSEEDEEDHHHGDARIEITPSEFKDLCPAFLVQLDQRACSQKLQAAESNPRREKKSFSQAWLYASACVLIISLCGLVGVAMVPLAKSIAYDDILRFLIALGVGTLCGDALMHLLPHALLPHDDHHSHAEAHGHGHGPDGPDHHHDAHSAEQRAMWLCLCAFGAAFFMYSLEMILPLFREGDGHGHHGHSHGGGHSQSNRVEPRAAPVHPAGNGAAHRHGDDIELDLAEGRSPGRKDKEAGAMLEKKSTKSKPMAAVAFMVVLGDGLHNITDGLAIGAAFAVDPVTGLATSFAILCHELPHELGDFALLLQTGVSIRRAIFLNIVSSVLSFIGMALGLLLTGMHESVVSWIYAGTAGTFLYIALSDLVPEMRNDLGRSEQKVKVILIQLVGLALGAIIMLLIALNEESLQMLFD